jgi:diguanylate cyclase (GGDEF)-like protein
MQPFLDDDTKPMRVPVCVQSTRACRPALTRIMGPRMGETFQVPTDRKSGIVVGRGPTVAVRVEDPAVSREHCRIWARPDGSIVLSDMGSTNGTIVNGSAVQEVDLAEGDKIQVGLSTVLRFSLNDRLDESYLDHLYQTSIRDVLTGVLNRRYLIECLERDLGLARRHGMPMALILIDADHFKTVNDSFGHRGGDEVLKELATLLAGMQRRESVFARYGGEEFAVLLRNVEPSGAEVFAERMRIAVDQHRFPVLGGTLRMTVSIGVALTTADGVHEPEALLDRADRYLYLAKAKGRNRVSCARTMSSG